MIAPNPMMSAVRPPPLIVKRRTGSPACVVPKTSPSFIAMPAKRQLIQKTSGGFPRKMDRSLACPSQDSPSEAEPADADILGIEIIFDTLMSAFLAQARFLDTAERC